MRGKKKKKSNWARIGKVGFVFAEGAGPISRLGFAVSGFQDHFLTEAKGCATIAST